MDDKVIQRVCWPNTCCGSILNHPCQSTHGKTQRLNQQSSQLQSRGLTWQVFCFIVCSLFDLPLLRPWMWCRHHTWNVGEVRLGSLELLFEQSSVHSWRKCKLRMRQSFHGLLQWCPQTMTVWYCLILFGCLACLKSLMMSLSCPQQTMKASRLTFTPPPRSFPWPMGTVGTVSPVSPVVVNGILAILAFCGGLKILWSRKESERGASHKKICLWQVQTPPSASSPGEAVWKCVECGFYEFLWTLRFQMWTWEADSPNALTPSRQVPAIWCLRGS